ncbi:MAG TPA: hypothetical protein DC009_07475 [Porphyromonadaceae bacterium]|nr:hypothetical protein [Porphyromonadaceae bacterium]
MNSWLSELVFGVDIDQLQTELVKSRAELAKLKNENDRLNSTVNARQNAIGRLTDRIKRKDETIANLRSAAQLHKQELKDKSSEVSALNRKTTKLRADLEKINNAVDRLNDKINRKDENIEELKTSAQQLKQELRSKTTEINRLNKSAEKLQDKVAELNEAISQQADCINDKDKAIADLKSTVQQQELDIQSKAAEIINLNDSVASLNDEVAKQNGAVVQWIENNNCKDKAISELESNIRQKELVIQGKLEEIASLNDALANFRNEITGLKEKIAVIKSSAKGNEEAISSLNDELGRYKSQVDEKEEEIQHLHEEIQSLKRNNKQLEFNLNEEKKECDKYSSENRALKLDNNALKSENDSLKEQLAEINRNLSQPETWVQSDTETEQSVETGSQFDIEEEPSSEVALQSDAEAEQLSDAESQSEAADAAEPSSEAVVHSDIDDSQSPETEPQRDTAVEPPAAVTAEPSSETVAHSGIDDSQSPEAETQRDTAGEQPSAVTAEPSSEVASQPVVEQPFEDGSQSGAEAEQSSDAGSQYESEAVSQPEAESESSDEEPQSEAGAKTQPRRSLKRTARTRTTLAPNGDNGPEDIPDIELGEQKSRRSIRKVIDTETDEVIDADEFFQQDNDTIQTAARFLEEAKATGQPKFVCFVCGQPVKIAKRGNNYYFQHWTSNPDCKYTPPSGQSPSSGRESLIPKEPGEDRDEMLDKICRQINNRSNVQFAEKKKLIPSVFPYMFYRRADIFVEFRNGNRLVIQFTDGKTSLKSLVDKDIFFWLHGIYVMWVYSNETYDYSGIRSIANQNAIFYCHRNIFFYDKECREMSDGRNEFIFKCNYLNEDNNWHYKRSTSSNSNNGELITLGNLTFPRDDVELKPYYFEANKPYFELHPDKEGEYISSHRNRDEYLVLLKEDWANNPARIEAIKRCMASNTNTVPFCYSRKWGLRFQGTTIVATIFDKKPELVNGVYVVCCNGQYGLVSGCSDKVLFDWTGISEILPLRENLFKFKKDRRYGIVDTDGEVKVFPEYVSITCVRNGLYKLDTGVYTKFVDEEFNEVEEESIPLKDGFVKIKRRGLWGMKNEAGEIVVDCKYSEISSFRSRFIGFINNKAIRLTASGNYNYRLPMCIGNSFRREGARYVVNVGGQKCVLQAGEHLPHIINGGKIDVAIVNMTKDSIIVTLKDTSKPLSKPIDKPDDFEMNKTYSGKVCRVLRNGKSTNYILKMDDGKKIFVNGKVIANGDEKLAVDTEVKITKTGYNHQLDKTLWKRVELS